MAHRTRGVAVLLLLVAVAGIGYLIMQRRAPAPVYWVATAEHIVLEVSTFAKQDQIGQQMPDLVLFGNGRFIAVGPADRLVDRELREGQLTKEELGQWLARVEHDLRPLQTHYSESTCMDCGSIQIKWTTTAGTQTRSVYGQVPGGERIQTLAAELQTELLQATQAYQPDEVILLAASMGEYQPSDAPEWPSTLPALPVASEGRGSVLVHGESARAVLNQVPYRGLFVYRDQLYLVGVYPVELRERLEF